MERPKLEVADIFRRYGGTYRDNHDASMSTAQRRVMTAIEVCRTSALGGQIEQCDQCGHQRICYRSRRNRHCPKCQSLARAEWIQRRQAELLDCEYFHVVFTVPEEIAAIAYQNAGRYTHRVAISNNRLLDIADGQVRFQWKDYRDKAQQKTMTLSAEEFIRRFLLHALPDGFQRIRYYGLLGNRYRQQKLARCRQLLGMAPPVEAPAPEDYRDQHEQLTGSSLRECPLCRRGRMLMVETLTPYRASASKDTS